LLELCVYSIPPVIKGLQYACKLPAAAMPGAPGKVTYGLWRPFVTRMQIALEARCLVKKYPAVLAVNDVSFDVAEGICFGLLGPNGAGKTTTVEIMEGVTSATSGEVWYYGSPAGRRFREEAGV